MSEDAIDLKEAMERIQDDKDLLLELFDIYLEDHNEKMGELRVSLQKNDIEQTKKIAHSLKGAAGNISAKKLHATFLKLEQLAKQNALAQIGEVIQEIDGQFAEFKTNVEKIKQDFQKA